MNWNEKRLSKLSVIAGPSSSDLAAKIAENLRAELLPAELRFFSDGESKIKIGKVGERCVVVQSTHPPVDTHLMQALMMIKKCADGGAKKICAVIPYVAYARQDRAFLEGEVVSIALVANLLQSAGAKMMVTVDIHSKLALSHFKIDVQNVSSIPLLANYAAKMKLYKPVVVSPDSGGITRAEEFAKILKTNNIALKKTRDRKTGEVTVDENVGAEIAGRDAILVDDMISSGSSIVKAAEVLKKNGSGKVYAVCVHALLTGDAAQKIKAAGVEDIISTNSVPNGYSKVDLSPVISTALRSML